MSKTENTKTIYYQKKTETEEYTLLECFESDSIRRNLYMSIGVDASEVLLTDFRVKRNGTAFGTLCGYAYYVWFIDGEGMFMDLWKFHKSSVGISEGIVKSYYKEFSGAQISLLRKNINLSVDSDCQAVLVQSLF